MTALEKAKVDLKRTPRKWLVTGVAGFIGSHLLENLLLLDQPVVGLDNFVAGHKKNLAQVKSLVSAEQWKRFEFVDGDVCDSRICQRACTGVDCVLHQAALGSVPRSIEDPLNSNSANVTGTLNMMLAARDHRVSRFVYASSSAVYGDDPALPKVEEKIGSPLSPYAVTKRVNELYAGVFAKCYGLETIGLRYFNVFGPRQDPNGPYAAVIPRWIAALINHEPIRINGDGETSRDFCFVANVVQVNLLAAMTRNPDAINQVYNVALNERTTLNELFRLLRDGLARDRPELRNCQPLYGDFRPGDVRHSQADISRAQKWLGYQPTHPIAQGLNEALGWYQENVA